MEGRQRRAYGRVRWQSRPLRATARRLPHGRRGPGRLDPIDPKAWVIVDGGLCLHGDKEGRDETAADPEARMAAAAERWTPLGAPLMTRRRDVGAPECGPVLVGLFGATRPAGRGRCDRRASGVRMQSLPILPRGVRVPLADHRGQTAATSGIECGADDEAVSVRGWCCGRGRRGRPRHRANRS